MNVHFNKIINVPERSFFFHCIRIVYIDKMETHYMPHPWTLPTYDAKRHLDPIRHYSIMQTNRPTHRLGKFDDYRPLCYESDVA